MSATYKLTIHKSLSKSVSEGARCFQMEPEETNVPNDAPTHAYELLLTKLFK